MEGKGNEAKAMQSEKPSGHILRRVYETSKKWGYANALLLTEILAFFIWGLRFHESKKKEQKKEKELDNE